MVRNRDVAEEYPAIRAFSRALRVETVSENPLKVDAIWKNLICTQGKYSSPCQHIPLRRASPDTAPPVRRGLASPANVTYPKFYRYRGSIWEQDLYNEQMQR